MQRYVIPTLPTGALSRRMMIRHNSLFFLGYLNLGTFQDAQVHEYRSEVVRYLFNKTYQKIPRKNYFTIKIGRKTPDIQLTQVQELGFQPALYGVNNSLPIYFPASTVHWRHSTCLLFGNLFQQGLRVKGFFVRQDILQNRVTQKNCITYCNLQMNYCTK